MPNSTKTENRGKLLDRRSHSDFPNTSGFHDASANQLTGKDINWNQVYFFSIVASCGSIKDAAERLGLSSSTLSEHIAQLEKDLAVLLFIRQHRKLTLTDEGTRLYLHAKEMFEAGKRLIDAVSPIPLGCYPISIGLVPNPSLQIAHELIGDYLEKYGAIDMKLHRVTYSELEDQLANAQCDFGFSDRLPERKDLNCHHILSSHTRLYVSMQWDGISFSKLLETLPLLICSAEPKAKTFVEHALADSGLTPRAVITSDYPGSLVDLCKRGLGIGVFSEKAVWRMNLDFLKTLRTPKDAPTLKSELYALWSKHSENTAAVKHLKEVLQVEKSNSGS